MLAKEHPQVRGLQPTTTDTTTSEGNNNDSATVTAGEVQCLVDDDYDSSIEFASIPQQDSVDNSDTQTEGRTI